ncbi:hypothetical protein [Massilia genomosp. 1]|uniref:Uncharacterized protein n=1 Tax=Massilia genomosp. 1 TaxID=2609280 RepID=A0ABX0MDU1_9BURK|nr:hypothetical protein [Massilia genomosp. 1]NHZ60855.1 hypothetical protein [Massilia genomosp. 1]
MRAAPVNHAASAQVVNPVQTSQITDAAATQAAHPDNSAAARPSSPRRQVSARDANMFRRLVNEYLTKEGKRAKTGHPNQLFISPREMERLIAEISILVQSCHITDAEVPDVDMESVSDSTEIDHHVAQMSSPVPSSRLTDAEVPDVDMESVSDSTEIDHQVAQMSSPVPSSRLTDAVAPDVRITSLAHPEVIDAFVAQMKAVEADWGKKSPAQKIEHLQNVINAQFEAARVPAPSISLMDLGGGRNGEFDSKTWSMGMTEETLGKRSMAETAGTVYHESRHAQQFFMIAKYIGQEGIAPPHSDQIPKPILKQAKEAVDKCAMGTDEIAEAKSYHTSVYGADREKRNATLRKLAHYTFPRLCQTSADFSKARLTYEEAVATLETYKGEQSPQFHDSKELREKDPTYLAHLANKRAAIKEFNRTLAVNKAEKVGFDAAQKAYHALPEEADAFAVGDAVTAKLEVGEKST